MINKLATERRRVIGGRIKRRPKGWCPERRARQAALIRRWAPWRRSTGPRTDEGKARSAINATRHGFRSRAYIERKRRVRSVLRRAARNIAIARAYLRLRNASRLHAHDLQTPGQSFGAMGLSSLRGSGIINLVAD